MCGRYTLRTPPSDWAPIFDVEPPRELQLRFNIAPTQEAPIVREVDGRREAAMARWGLVPSWAEDPTIGSRMINARSETAATLPAFREAYRRRRCLVPADGFYEWQAEGKRKQPYYICRGDRRPWAFAGLWETWKREELQLLTFTILTTESNELLRPLHDRMPVILQPDEFPAWLDGQAADPLRLLRPFPVEEMTLYAVQSAVNNARHDAEDCLTPAATNRTLF